jgi:hypothetical protein
LCGATDGQICGMILIHLPTAPRFFYVLLFARKRTIFLTCQAVIQNPKRQYVLWGRNPNTTIILWFRAAIRWRFFGVPQECRAAPLAHVSKKKPACSATRAGNDTWEGHPGGNSGDVFSVWDRPAEMPARRLNFNAALCLLMLTCFFCL